MLEFPAPRLTDSHSVTMSDLLQIAGVCERDLDLLLVEELIASPAFRSWITDLTRITGVNHSSIPIIRRSVTHSSGESDVELYVNLEVGGRAAVLIENKVDAALQPFQAERYRLRGTAYVTGGKCQFFRTLIIAPKRYFGSNPDTKGFDASLTYEAILEWYGTRTDLGARGVYKSALLLGAIEKATLGYQQVADQRMTEFWDSYYRWVQRESASLNMPEPRGRPAGSTFIFFKPDRLPRSCLLVHKFWHGYVDLEFSGWGHRLSELRAVVGPLMRQGDSLVRIGKSAAIRYQVPALDATSPESQEALALVCIRAAADLLSWYEQHRVELSPIGPQEA